MKIEKLFNYEKLRELVISTFGHRSYAEVSSTIGVTRQRFTDWMNGKSKNGPGASSWNKLITLFETKGIHIKISDFYLSSDQSIEKTSTTEIKEILEDNEIDYKKGIDGNNSIDKLCNYNIQLQEVIKQRNEEINKLHSDIVKYKNEIKLLKKQIKELKNL